MQDVSFPLDAYLDRIGLEHPRRPDLAALRAVVAHHSAAIPFESIEPFLGRGVPIDLPALIDKLIHRRRGGYCFEQNLLLMAALRALGFDAEPRLARVIRGQPDDAMTPRTHVMLRVALAEGAFLTDVGFGNLTPTAPLAFASDAPQPTPHEDFRLVAAGDAVILRALVGVTWESLYRLGPETPAHADLEVANWFTASHPASPFTGNLVIARPAEGQRHTLFNTRHARRGVNGVEVTRVTSPSELADLLMRSFGLRLDPGDTEALFVAASERPEDSRFRGFFA